MSSIFAQVLLLVFICMGFFVVLEYRYKKRRIECKVMATKVTPPSNFTEHHYVLIYMINSSQRMMRTAIKDVDEAQAKVDILNLDKISGLRLSHYDEITGEEVKLYYAPEGKLIPFKE